MARGPPSFNPHSTLRIHGAGPTHSRSLHPPQVRFYLCRDTTYGADPSFSEENLVSLHNAVLKVS